MINQDITLEQINSFNANTLTSHIGIVFTGFGEKYLEAKMPVDKRTHQPMGLLHGGASAVLIESMGSLGSALCVDLKTQHIVGLEINANHIRSIKSGFVFGKAELIHEGRTTHIWNVSITDENQKLISTGRLTVLVKNNK
jgi:1,4-dihydroxy-2-naphthoyl-CoA hydrolase